MKATLEKTRPNSDAQRIAMGKKDKGALYLLAKFKGIRTLTQNKLKKGSNPLVATTTSRGRCPDQISGRSARWPWQAWRKKSTGCNRSSEVPELPKTHFFVFKELITHTKVAKKEGSSPPFCTGATDLPRLRAPSRRAPSRRRPRTGRWTPRARRRRGAAGRCTSASLPRAFRG